MALAWRRALAAAALSILAPLAALAAAGDPIAVPKLTGHVVDLAGMLTERERTGLEAKLADFERARGSQVAVLLVPSIGAETIEDFAGRVTDEWKLGRKGVDDGVLFAVAQQERKLRIHTGRGVQGTLTDALSKRIVSDIVAPRFKSGDFGGGIDAGADAIMKAIEGEALPLPAKRASKVDTMSSFSDFLWIGFFLVPIVGMILRGLVGRVFGAGLTSGITALAAWFVFGSIAFAVLAAFLAFVFTVVAGSGLARNARGGYIGPGGFGGGGFGGGGFGGGGASGSW